MSESSASAGDGDSGNELWAPPFPGDILPRIVARLTCADHAALRATCKSWRTIFSAIPPSPHPGLLPFLLLPPHFALPDPLCLSHRTPPYTPPFPTTLSAPSSPSPPRPQPFRFPLLPPRQPPQSHIPPAPLPLRHHPPRLRRLLPRLAHPPRPHLPHLPPQPLTAATIPLPPRSPPLRHLAALVRLAVLSADPTDDPSSFILVLVLGNTISARVITCGPSDGYAAWRHHTYRGFPAYGVTDLIFHHGLCFAAVMWRTIGDVVLGPGTQLPSSISTPLRHSRGSAGFRSQKMMSKRTTPTSLSSRLAIYCL
uniref:F-box domain-containing protein n=1 Tax=Ananas comosus var. bracteatus TaxID=296719 RepID=A0A6V7PEC8_ANACO|nr:unnamed protein product [Ananas comosus var. bracteatus]